MYERGKRINAYYLSVASPFDTNDGHSMNKGSKMLLTNHPLLFYIILNWGTTYFSLVQSFQCIILIETQCIFNTITFCKDNEQKGVTSKEYHRTYYEFLSKNISYPLLNFIPIRICSESRMIICVLCTVS